MNVKAQFDTATDCNEHTAATQILNNAILAKFPESSVHLGYAAILENIALTQELAGYLSPLDGRLRDAIQAVLISECKLHGFI